MLVFLPQIVILFFFILALEDSGYLPRAAYLLDRLMGGVGLSGRAFIPLLSSHACAIPGIMADAHHPELARPPDHHHDRAAHDLLGAPAGVRAADRARSFRARDVGPFNLQGLVLFALYVAGIVSALLVALVMKQFAGAAPVFAADARAAGLPVAARRQPAARPVGAREDLPEPRRRHHPRADDRAVVPVELSRAAAGGATGPAIQYSFAGQARRAARIRLRAHRLQLADLDRAGAGPRGARSRGRRARHGVRDVRRGRRRRRRSSSR